MNRTRYLVLTPQKVKMYLVWIFRISTYLILNFNLHENPSKMKRSLYLISFFLNSPFSGSTTEENPYSESFPNRGKIFFFLFFQSEIYWRSSLHHPRQLSSILVMSPQAKPHYLSLFSFFWLVIWVFYIFQNSSI